MRHPPSGPTRQLVVLAVALATGVSLCSCVNKAPAERTSSTSAAPTPSPTPSPTATSGVVGASAPRTTPLAAAPFRHPIPGMPSPLPGGVYAAAGPGMVAPTLRHQPHLLYVPDSEIGGRTIVISPRTHRIVRVLNTGSLNQHVTPSWDLETLYVEASASNHLAEIDPATGRMIGTVMTSRPYNLYFTPDGRHAIVMDEQHDQIVFSDPHSLTREHTVSDPGCRGPNHADFSANGRYFLVSCEFSGAILKVSTLGERVLGRIRLPMPAMPQDVRLAPDGRSFFVADMGRNRLLQIPWRRLRIWHAYPTLEMPHGIYFSRDQRLLYLSDRMAGAVQVFDLARQRFTQTWKIPGGGSPDMGGLSIDGRTLWLSGRYDGVVYGFDTRTGTLIAKIRVPARSPHGLLVWPQPGRYSLGHTGLMR
ncbi:YncE family protein [Nocardioides sp. CER19]|uniref:YncE family protein n=1 Tax=Nocardioides sp. CER19 TaxID=3038538 RepID=UPI00244BAA99|nr:YncE family protein [Nocardioides sp. CER19]MDH2414171.1 beta-propeller fold lactonase family protein [Nocardioides sp. CER19]